MAERAIVTLADKEALANHVAAWLTDLAAASTGRFSVALSGGSTPKRLYEVLAETKLSERFPWARTHFFLGDERMVPPDDANSNLRMARLSLLDHVPVPPGNIHAMPTEMPLEEAAASYQATLRAFYGADMLDPSRPLFDVVLLGLGDNGHTASLFPGTSSLGETLAWVVPVTENVPQPRLTLTYPAIGSSTVIAFLVSGASKSAAVAKVLAGDRTQPAARVTTVGTLIWFIDEAAAGDIAS